MPNRKHSTEPDTDEDEQDSILHLPTSGNPQYPCSTWGIDLLGCELSNLKFIWESTNAEVAASALHRPGSPKTPANHGNSKSSSTDTPKVPGHYSVDAERTPNVEHPLEDRESAPKVFDSTRPPQNNPPPPKQNNAISEPHSGRWPNVSTLEVSIRRLLSACCHGELEDGDHQNLDNASKMLASIAHRDGIMRQTVVSTIQRLVPKLDRELETSVFELVFNEINQHWAETSNINAGLPPDGVVPVKESAPPPLTHSPPENPKPVPLIIPSPPSAGHISAAVPAQHPSSLPNPILLPQAPAPIMSAPALLPANAAVQGIPAPYMSSLHPYLMSGYQVADMPSGSSLAIPPHLQALYIPYGPRTGSQPDVGRAAAETNVGGTSVSAPARANVSLSNETSHTSQMQANQPESAAPESTLPHFDVKFECRPLRGTHAGHDIRWFSSATDSDIKCPPDCRQELRVADIYYHTNRSRMGRDQMWIFNENRIWEDITKRYHDGTSIPHPTIPTAVLSKTESGKPTFVLEGTHKSSRRRLKAAEAQVAGSRLES